MVVRLLRLFVLAGWAGKRWPSLTGGGIGRCWRGTRSDSAAHDPRNIAQIERRANWRRVVQRRGGALIVHHVLVDVKAADLAGEWHVDVGVRCVV